MNSPGSGSGALPAYTPAELAPRAKDSHKGDHGHAFVVGGSAGMSGAPVLAGLAAFRTGAGRVTVLLPDPVRAEAAGFAPELMVRGAPATLTGHLARRAGPAIAAALEGADAALFGPGLGRHPATAVLIRSVLQAWTGPAVVDADALPAASGLDPSPLRIFTPHPGEAARLLGTSAGEVQRDRAGAVEALQILLGGVVVLKGMGTLVAGGGRLASNPTGGPALGKAGTGDVLAGVVLALLAQGHDPFEAAALGAWVHGKAADRLSQGAGERGLSPLALIDGLPEVLRDLEGAG